MTTDTKQKLLGIALMFLPLVLVVLLLFPPKNIFENIKNIKIEEVQKKYNSYTVICKNGYSYVLESHGSTDENFSKMIEVHGKPVQCNRVEKVIQN